MATCDYHVTFIDDVFFFLRLYRVKHVTSSSGMFCGLQTLADPDGEKLWKKLYFR